MINSCCHVYAIWYAIRDRVAEWVPTGASPDGGQVPVVVNRILCTWIVVVQVSLWAGLALRVHQYGWHQYWATEVLGWRAALHDGALHNSQQRSLETSSSRRR